MRIDTLNKVSQLYQSNSTKKLTKSSSSSSTDKLEISQAGKEYQIAKKAVSAAPDVRMDKVNDIKSRMDSGTYNVSAEEVANKLVEGLFNSVI